MVGQTAFNWEREANPAPDECASVLVELEAVSGPVTRPELRQRTNLSDRAIRAAVVALVLDGHPIVTDRAQGGYELCRDPERVSTEIARLRHHAGEMLKRANALEVHR